MWRPRMEGNASADLQISQTVLLAMAGHDCASTPPDYSLHKIWRNLAGFIGVICNEEYPLPVNARPAIRPIELQDGKDAIMGEEND